MNTRQHILVVDDDPLFRNLMTTILGKEFHVTVASEGSEGFHKAVENPPHLAILDLQMPGWDGLRTLKALKSHPSLNQLKIVIMTSDSTRKMVLEAIKSGAHDYIIKTSFRREEFLSKLQRLLPDWQPESLECRHALVMQNRLTGTQTVESDAVKLDDTTTADNADQPKPHVLAGHTPHSAPVPALVGSTTAINDPAVRAMMDNWE
ncbi:MAG: response regulator [Planctomycetaceae bacterium]